MKVGGLCIGPLVDLFFDHQCVKPQEFVALLDDGATFDDRRDRVLTPDLATNLRVLGTLQGPGFDDRHIQVVEDNRVGQLGAVWG